MEYLVVKWLHILFSTFLFGTGVGTAFYLFFISFEREPLVLATVTRYVVRADWLFTATTALLQPLTGFWLVNLAGFPLQSRWLMWSIGLYVVAIACWLPVIVLQMRMRDHAVAAAVGAVPLPPAYWRCFRWWVALGVPALFSFLAIFWLMVAKPA